jgi:hypothetical protein
MSQAARLDCWPQLSAKRQLGGMSVRAFCQQNRTNEYRLYNWSKHLREQRPRKFALVETSQSEPAAVAVLEVILASGERLRIVPGTGQCLVRRIGVREKTATPFCLSSGCVVSTCGNPISFIAAYRASPGRARNSVTAITSGS